MRVAQIIHRKFMVFMRCIRFSMKSFQITAPPKHIIIIIVIGIVIVSITKAYKLSITNGSTFFLWINMNEGVRGNKRAQALWSVCHVNADPMMMHGLWSIFKLCIFHIHTRPKARLLCSIQARMQLTAATYSDLN